MKKARVIARWLPGAFAVCVLTVAIGADEPRAQQPPPAKPAAARVRAAAAGTARGIDASAVMTRYCVTCHNERLKTGGLVLEGVDPAQAGAHAEVFEKAVRKLRVGAMPPAGAPRPDGATLLELTAAIESQLDKAAALHPNPGRTETFHRLNRTEYANAIQDLLALDVDVASLIPGDETSFGFDNIAGVQKVSPVFMERYAAAAQKISRLAVGSMDIPASETVLRFSSDVNQDDYTEGLPLGTRGGRVVRHTFPLDAEYEIRTELLRDGNDLIPRYNDPHTIEVTVDGERAQLFTFGEKRAPGARRGGGGGNNNGRGAAAAGRGNGGRQGGPGREGGGGGEGGAGREGAAARDGGAGRDNENGIVDVVVDRMAASAVRDRDFIARVKITAGVHDLGLAFVKKSSALPLTQREWFQRPVAGIGDTRYEPQLGVIVIAGPFNATGPGDTPSRQKVFTCRPAASADEPRCARQIVSTIARRAYRRPVTDSDLQPLLQFFDQGRTPPGGSFETGIELALRRILVSPSFLFRVEADPAQASPNTSYRISDLELASRLSFFLWSSIPDDQLLDLAARGQLKNATVLNQQVRRMLADPRSEALVRNFTGQWLYLRNVAKVPKDGAVFPDFEGSLRQAFVRETELFFDSIMRDEKASVLDLLRAKYTYLNQPLARYYGIPNVYGSNFRRVELPGDVRPGGILGQGSVLMTTSYPTRTSPVIRGKWIMTNLLGVPPPDPPPNVPALQESSVGQAVAVVLSVRERMEAHRASPNCSGCHKLMDPIGLALENFDAVGRWRTLNETGSRIDTSGVLFDGAKVDGPAALRDALLSHPESIVRTVAARMMTYALGRGLEYYDEPVVRKITQDGGNTSFTTIITGIVNSMPFQMRRSPS